MPRWKFKLASQLFAPKRNRALSARFFFGATRQAARAFSKTTRPRLIVARSGFVP